MNVFEAKRRFGTIYMIEFDDEARVVFRPLLHKEYKSYRAVLTAMPNYEDSAMEDIFLKCLIDMTYPYTLDDEDNPIVDFDLLPAGVIDTVAHFIFSVSGADSQDKFFNDLAESRVFANYDLEYRVFSIIANALRVDISSFDDLTWEEILRRIAQAELILSGNIPKIPFLPAEPEEKKLDFDADNKEEAKI